MELIGLTGYAQHGKDTLGRELVTQAGFERHAFADGLRHLAARTNPYVIAEPYKPNRYAGLVDDYGYEDAKRLPEVRRLLQELGTAVRDIIGEDAWVQALQRQLVHEPPRVVITDVRFPNEAAWVQSLGGIVVRVTREHADGEPYDNGVGTGHASEAGVDAIDADYEVRNVEGNPAVLRGVTPWLAGLAANRAARYTAEPKHVAGVWRDSYPDAEPIVTTSYEATLANDDSTPYERSYRYRRLDKVPDHEHLA